MHIAARVAQGPARDVILKVQAFWRFFRCIFAIWNCIYYSYNLNNLFVNYLTRSIEHLFVKKFLKIFSKKC